MGAVSLSRRDIKAVDDLVSHYEQNRELFERFMQQVAALFLNCKALVPFIHSMKWRVKDPSHLRDKLQRKCLELKRNGKHFDITRANLFKRITDLVGFRILHLYTRQVDDINRIILALLKEEKWVLVEGPVARTWDNEYRDYFQGIGMGTVESQKTMYTSVHYVFKANKQTQCACELQVRTLAEELWGEVDHALNYPHKVDVFACREQIKVLARVTSSCTRLVDSIFQTHEDAKTK